MPPSCQITNVITFGCAPWFHGPKPFPQKLGIGGGGWWCIWFGLAIGGNLWKSPPCWCLSKEDPRIISGSRSTTANIRSQHQHEKVLHEKLAITEESYESSNILHAYKTYETHTHANTGKGQRLEAKTESSRASLHQQERNIRNQATTNQQGQILI